MRLELDGGEVIDLGLTEDAPTIGIIDYSGRETDDFGVTTVVQRGFARRMSVRLGLPFDDVDAVQQRLAEIRATPALWVADDDIASLSVRGFYKDFELDLAVPPFSYCTLTVEGLALTDDLDDSGADPAPDGTPSTLRLLQPIDIVSGVVTTSNVPEADYPTWSALTTYAQGARVILGTHRIYESTVGGNAGHNPTAGTGEWIDVGPTNRWAMFDQALGTVTTNAGSIVVTLDVGDERSIALIDVAGDTVRVQATGHDETVVVTPGTIVMSKLPAAPGVVTVTIAGTGSVAVGTLLLGTIVGLGITEASPTAGITDYSRKEVDDFGEITIVQRAWAKRMAAKALIGTAGVDDVVSRFVAVRARPALWIGDTGTDSLTIYGFWKDFSIEVGEAVSKLSLSIEGLSLAAPVAPSLGEQIAVAGTTADWSKVVDDNGKRPADNATVGMTLSEVAIVAAALSAISAAESQIDAIEGTISVDIPALQADIIAIGGDIANLSTDLTTANSGISSLWTAVSNVEGDLASITTRVGAAETTIETQQLAIDTIDTQVATVSTNLTTALANISLNATAITTLQGAQATLSSTVAAQGSSITTLQSATTTLLGTTASLTTQVSAGRPNLAINGDFSNGTSAWQIFGGLNYAVYSQSIGTFLDCNNPTGATSYWVQDIGPAEVSVGETYEMSLEGSYGPYAAGAFYQIQFLNAAKSVVVGASSPFGPGGWGTRVASGPAVCPAGTAYIRLVLVIPSSLGLHTTRVMLQRGGATIWQDQASVRQQYSALSTLTTNYASLSSTVSVQGVTVSSHSTAISTINGNITSLFGRIALTVDVGGRVTGIEVNGTPVAGGIKFHADSVSFEKPGGGARCVYANGLWQTYDAAGTLRMRWGVAP